MLPARTNPAAENGGHREIIITDWKPYQKGSLQGFFTATLPSGLVLHSVMLHQQGGTRWVGFPAREWTNEHGQKQYARLIDFIGRETADKFREEALAALDTFRQRYL